MRRPFSRREFIARTALTGAAAGLTATGVLPGTSFAAASNKKLNVLILGGTGQTGPHLVADLLGAGHTVTLLNRGNRSAELFPELECIVADREPGKEGGLAALEAELAKDRRWDVAIDIWPHIPKIVEKTATMLQKSVDHFMYVSSISVYADHSQPGQDESGAVGEAPDADDKEFTMELFGPFKAECENRVRRLFPKNHTIVRPGLIVGPRDFSFRGGYWPVRVRRGGEVLAPGGGDDRIQLVDGRDLTAFEARCMAKGIFGTFNVTGPNPKAPLTMRRLLETCRDVSGSDATFTWADAAFLGEHQVGPWMQMPCWLPPEGEYAGFGTRSVDKAVSAGLTFRPLADTVRDTLSWYDGLTEENRARVTARAGIPAEKEAEVLAALHAARAETKG